jgi:hypothetical protein
MSGLPVHSPAEMRPPSMDRTVCIGRFLRSPDPGDQGIENIQAPVKIFKINHPVSLNTVLLKNPYDNDSTLSGLSDAWRGRKLLAVVFLVNKKTITALIRRGGAPLVAAGFIETIYERQRFREINQFLNGEDRSLSLPEFPFNPLFQLSSV